MKSYVCVLSTDNYLNGVLILNENLKHLKSKYPLLCIINEGISDKTKNILKYFGINYIRLQSISYDVDNDNGVYGRYGTDKAYLKYTFDKLNIFYLTDYEKLVYLDSDMLFLENLDHLFDLPSISVARDIPFKEDGFNSGLMVVKPNFMDFFNLYKLASKSSKAHIKISDQDILNDYFKDVNYLDHSYNLMREISNETVDLYDGIKGKKIKAKKTILYSNNDNNAKVIHYIGKQKPFMITDDFDDKYEYLYRFYQNFVLSKLHEYNIFMNKELISIIIPVYNAEKYLRRCLDSVLNQIYSNIEVIVVDDGSSDGSLDILNEYKVKDSRIKVYKQKNSGVSSARNKGLSKAKGSLIGFVDADDFIEPYMYASMAKELVFKNADFVQCGIFYNNAYLKYCYDSPVVSNSNEDIYLKFIFEELSSTVWDKLYRKELIEDIKFEKDFYKNEDLMFNFEVIKKANRMVFTGIPSYHYSNCKEGALTNKFSYDKDCSYFIFIDRFLDYSSKFDYLNMEKDIYKFCYNLLSYLVYSLNKLNKSEIEEDNPLHIELFKRYDEINERLMNIR